jgi:hypothetical protein
VRAECALSSGANSLSSWIRLWLPLAEDGGSHGYLRVLRGSHIERHPHSLPIPVIAILEDPDAHTRQPHRLDDAPSQWLKKKGTKSNRADRARPPLPAAAAGAELRHSEPRSRQPNDLSRPTCGDTYWYLAASPSGPVAAWKRAKPGTGWSGWKAGGASFLASPVVDGLLMEPCCSCLMALLPFLLSRSVVP